MYPISPLGTQLSAYSISPSFVGFIQSGPEPRAGSQSFTLPSRLEMNLGPSTGWARDAYYLLTPE
ncbi:hypothetical protein, partial [Ancrocorticia populi]|uniref:hypothetical protein n=1 Tax=Ancrocorticia populi TaxID=2175228 RepID=UPI003F9E5536